jgi:hypothetical protein
MRKSKQVRKLLCTAVQPRLPKTFFVCVFKPAGWVDVQRPNVETMKNSLFVFLLLLMVATAASAQDRTPRANTRQAAQRARIAEGRADGDLTTREAAALNANQRHIRRTERRAKADGDVTVAERRQLEKKQDRANRRIRRAKNNDLEKPQN